MQDGYNADAIHGELSQAQRDHVMSRFRNKKLQLLVATDVAARGIDINELTHVINYNLPDDNLKFMFIDLEELVEPVTKEYQLLLLFT